MSGGIAYVLDEDGTFRSRCNMAMVDLEPMPDEEEISERIYHHIHDLESHGRVEVLEDMTRYDAEPAAPSDHTARAAHRLGARGGDPLRLEEILSGFRKVMPLEYRRALPKWRRRTMQAAE